jgi:hypothetical protein
MANWQYKLKSGSALREAIYNEDEEQVVKCLLLCYKELQSKLTEEDKDYKGMEIEDIIFNIENFDDGEDVNDYLEYFYDICDELRAWIEI